MSLKIDKATKEKAVQFCQEGLKYYHQWDVEQAINAFASAVELDNTEATYFLYLAQACVRLGDYESTRKALGEFIHLETDETLISRFEAMFGSALDEVETHLTENMSVHAVPLEVIGAGIQMWFEFRLTMGRDAINLAGIKPKVWAAALDYTTRKVNFHDMNIHLISEWYGISPEAVKHYHNILVETLDIMPCDYRYFRGAENPLDKLIEAATMLEELEERFYET